MRRCLLRQPATELSVAYVTALPARGPAMGITDAFGVPILDFLQAQDCFVAGLRDPIYMDRAEAIPLSHVARVGFKPRASKRLQPSSQG